MRQMNIVTTQTAMISLMVRRRLALRIPPNLNLKKLVNPSQREPSMPGTLQGNNSCLNNNRLQASQTADVDANKTTVIHDQNVFTKVKLSTNESCADMTDDLTEEEENCTY